MENESNSDEYTVILRGQKFTLTKDQIESDSPNYFTGCFLGDFKEGRTREVKLGRNPILFAFILEHLSGYEILPLAMDQIPPKMTPETALKNLIADALFYCLENLHKRLIEAQKLPPPQPKDSERCYIFFHVYNDKSASAPCPISSDLALKIAERYGIQYHTKLHLLNSVTRWFFREPGWQLVACWKENHEENGLDIIFSIDPPNISKLILEGGIIDGIIRNFPPWRDSMREEEENYW